MVMSIAHSQVILTTGAKSSFASSFETFQNASASMVASDQGLKKQINPPIIFTFVTLQVPKDLARLESLLVMIDRWSLGYSCAVLLVGILQVPLSYCNVLIDHQHHDHIIQSQSQPHVITRKSFVATLVSSSLI